MNPVPESLAQRRRKRRARNWMLVVVVFVFILGIRAFTARPMDPTSYYDATQPMVIAHRGGAGLRPENTALAVEHATNTKKSVSIK